MPYTSDPLNALLGIRDGSPDARWNFPLADGSPAKKPGGIGSGVVLSYSFLTSQPSYSDSDGFRPFSETEKQATRDILASIASVARITFQEVASGGELTFAIDSQEDTLGYAYFPEYSYSARGKNLAVGSKSEHAGGIWLSGNEAWGPGAFLPGGSGYGTLIHEIGHALGLKHPFESDLKNGYVLASSLDSYAHTVMSYTNHPYSIVGVDDASGEYAYVEPETLMPFDIAALQHLYGENADGSMGDDIYTFDSGRPFIKTLWDAGGTDTISVAGFSLGCVIDLGAGRHSSIAIASRLGAGEEDEEGVGAYDGTDNLAIAQGVTIENAIGGQGGDLLAGNQAGNRLEGSAGDDTLVGGAGDDTLVGGDGADRFAFDMKPGAANIDAIEDFLGGTDKIILSAKVFTRFKTDRDLSDNFVAGSGIKAADKNDYLLFDAGTGTLFYDADGSGKKAGLAICKLVGVTDLAASDLSIA